MRSRAAAVGLGLTAMVLLAACNPQDVEVTYNETNTGGCSSLVTVAVRYRYDGPTPARIVVTQPDGTVTLRGLAVNGQTFAIGGYFTGGCIVPPPNTPPAVKHTFERTVTADDGGGTLRGNLTAQPVIVCPLSSTSCKTDPTPLFL